MTRPLILIGCLMLQPTLWVVTSAQEVKPELVAQTGHTSLITSVAFSSDGKLLASGDMENTIKLWDVLSGKVLRTLGRRVVDILPSDNSVNSIAFLPDGKTLVSAGYTSIRLWDVATGQARVLHQSNTYSHSFALSPDGKIVAAGFQDGTVKLWDVATGRELHTFSGHADFVGAVTFSRDGKTLASGGSFHDKTIRLWEVATGRLIQILTGATIGIGEIAFSPDGNTLVSDGDVNKGINWWDIASGREIKTTYGHDGYIASMKFSPDGKLMATAGGGDKGAVMLWDVATGRILKSFPQGSMSVEFSPDGKTLASAGGKFDISRLWEQEHNVKLWEVATGREVKTFSGRSGGASVIASARDGKTIAASGGRDIELWSGDGGRVLKTLRGHNESVSALVLSPDGEILASAGQDQTVKLWDAVSGRELRSFEGITRSALMLRFSPDGETLLGVENGPPVMYVSPDGRTTTWTSAAGTIWVWEVASGRQLKSYPGYDPLGFSGDDKMLASSSKDSLGREDNSIKILNIVTGEQSVLKGHTARVFMAAFSPDGKRLASVSEDKTIRLWDISTGQAVLAGFDKNIPRIAFSSDGRTLVVGDWATNDVKFLDAASGREVHSFRMAKPPDAREVFTVAPAFFKDDYRQIVTAGGEFRISIGENGKIDLFDFNSGELLASLIALDEEDWAVVTPGGLFDGTPAAWGELIWRLGDNVFDYAPVETFFNEFYYPELLPELLAGKRPVLPNGRDIAKVDRRQPKMNVVLSDRQAPAAPLTERIVKLKIDVAENTNKPASASHPATGGARDVRLFRNGSLVKVWRGDVLKGQKSITMEVAVPVVAGRNHFTAYAFNHDNVKSPDATLDLNAFDGLKRAGTAYVLAVGVNSYANPEYNLKFATADARDFAAEFKRQQERLGQYAKIEVVPLYNGDATKANIMRALAELAVRVQPEDAVVVYFAGHGTALGNRFYLIPYDIGYMGSRDKLDAGGMRQIVRHGISDEELEVALENVDAGRLLMIVDSCNSGQALEAEEKRRGPMNSKGLAQLAYEKGMYILTAAQSYQDALESPKLGRGYLTYALVEGLKTAKADTSPQNGEVSAREWLDFTAWRVPQLQAEKIKDTPQPQKRPKRREEFLTSDNWLIQKPRVFYRREIESHPLIVVKLKGRSLN